MTPEEYAKSKGYGINLPMLEAVKKNDGYCPCRLTKDSDTMCPCLAERQEGKCICKLYNK